MVAMDTGNYDVIVAEESLDVAKGDSTAPRNVSCTTQEIVLHFLLHLAELNETTCTNITSGQMPHERIQTLVSARLLYAYFTPIVFFIGIVGNSLSLSVFISKKMRHLSASTYLAALSTSDLFALVFYVLIEWLVRGLPIVSPGSRLAFMLVPGVCQLVLYLQYVSRFLSSWLVVAFTIERYIGVCHPLRRRHVCSLSGSRKIVSGIIVIAFLINIFKPLLSVAQYVELHGHTCTAIPQHRHLSFVLDSIYAVSITFVPFVIITLLNSNIIRQLYIHNRQQRKMRVVTEESVIKLEFTLILLVVSFCFIALNLPYFATWCKLFLTSDFLSISSFQDLKELDYLLGISLFTRAIFYINYCINFFLYSITGGYFRRELKSLLLFWSREQRMTWRSTRMTKNCSTCETSFRALSQKDSDGDSAVKAPKTLVNNSIWV